MKNKRTYYQLILDRSGSMNDCIEQTVDGVNQQIRRIKELASRFPEQELFTSLTLFNHHLTQPWTRIRPENLREITFSDYRPEGTTALLDAIGITVTDLQKTIESEIVNDEATAVVVIVTDGYENASKNYTHPQVASMIQELELTGKWIFSYIGATLDAVEIAQTLNIKKNNSMHYNVSESTMMYNNVNTALNFYLQKKQMGKISSDFLEDEEKNE